MWCTQCSNCGRYPAAMPDHRDLTFTPATELRDLIRSRQGSPVEVLESVLARAETVQPRLCPFVTLDADAARGAGGRTSRCPGGTAGAAARHSHFDQRPRPDPRPAHHVRLEILGEQYSD